MVARLFVIGYADRLVADHRALLQSARVAGFEAELVSPSSLSLAVDTNQIDVLVDGRPVQPDVVIPRGMNRPWPFVAQVLEEWAQRGALVVPSVHAADTCADKLRTSRMLAEAGVPVVPSVGIAPGPDNHFAEIFGSGTVIAKPARASKGRGIERYENSMLAESGMKSSRPLVAGMVDHHVMQPLASGSGIDYRVVVAERGPAGSSIVAVTRRIAPDGEFVTNRPGSIVEDVHDPEQVVPDVCEVARRATRALGLSFGGVDVIEHLGRASVLEVNAWPGLAAEVRGTSIADALVEVAITSMSRDPQSTR